MSFKDQTILIAGGNRGIGYELARLLLADQAQVFIVGRSQARNELAQESLCAEFGSPDLTMLNADLGNRVEVDDIVHQLEGLFIDHLAVFLGSGKTPFGYNFPMGHWKTVFDVNFFSIVQVIQSFLPIMNRQGASSSITLTGAISGLERVRAPVTYSVAKATLISYSNHLAESLIEDGIRVNTISPGNVFYPGGRWEELLEEHPEEIKQFLQEAVGMKRLGTAEELAYVYYTTMSSKNSFMTGQNIVVDGLQTRAP